MADFVAILSKTIDGLGDRNTAEMRQRVYERARKAISDKLEAINPPPSKAQADRQYKLLDEAIDTLEVRYAPAVETPVTSDPLADFLATADEALQPKPVVSPAPKAADAFKQSTFPPFPGAGAVKSTESLTSPGLADPSLSTSGKPISQASRPDPVLGLDSAESLEVPSPPHKKPVSGSTGSGAKGAIFAVLGLLVIGGAGYAGYVYKDRILGSAEDTPAVTPKVAVTPEETKPAATQTPAQPDPATETPPKMTQRLTEDGAEIDAGPASAPQDVGEGATVATATTPSTVPPAVQETPQTQPQSVAIGQKAIFYEEKTGTEQGTADQGSVVWSVVQDSPGLDQPPEPAIRGDISIPENGIAMRLTIKRNVDKSLPASHIIEMLFSTPADFAGGAIENVSRFSLKDTEQAPGNPVVGVPASFGDGFFLMALTDEKTAIDTNLQLLDRQNWIDIPVAYRTGRRALLSFEKGLAGDKVFKEVLKAWADLAGAASPAPSPAAGGG